MTTQFASDLRVARRKAGLTQEDLSHLLVGQQSLISELERGKRRPSLEQIIDLSLIYGRSFDSLFQEVLAERRAHLTKRLKTLPDPTMPLTQTFNRDGSLSSLRQRLVEPPEGHVIA